MNKIENSDDIKTLIDTNPNIILVTYRGTWCPFCKKYLSKLSESLKSMDKSQTIIGISAESVEQSQNLKKKLSLDFDLVSDQNLIMADFYKVNTGDKGKGRYLQPSVFVFRDGEKVYEWIQKPSLFKNMGGAINRMTVDDALKELNSLPTLADKK